MFSKAEAPFFHFGQSLLFPNLDRAFTQHLAAIFAKVTQCQVDENELWRLFQAWHFIPQLLRSLVERLVLDPNLTIQQASVGFGQALFDETIYVTLWSNLSSLERLLLQHIMLKQKVFFSKDVRKILAHQLGQVELPISTIQSALRTLQRKKIVSKLDSRGHYDIEDQYFINWLTKNL